MNTNDEASTAVDVIRCVYLARVAEKRGDSRSAQRWQAKADAWLESCDPADRPCPLADAGRLALEPPTDIPTPRAT